MPRNAGIIGKNSASAGQELKGLYDLDDKFLNRIDTSFGFGYLYALSYVASTGGTITIYDGGADITSTLNAYANSTNGDALFLPPGNYETDGYEPDSFSELIFPSGYYGVFGSDPQDTLIFRDGTQVANRDAPVWGWTNATFDYPCKVSTGYLTVLRTVGTRSTNYTVALFRGFSTYLDYISIKNVAVNCGAQPYSVLYDNNNNTNHVSLFNSTIGNTGTDSGNYSGSTTNKDLTNCLFDDTQDGGFTKVNTTTSATISTSGNFLTYDTGTYSDRGHLYNLTDTTWTDGKS